MNFLYTDCDFRLVRAFIPYIAFRGETVNLCLKIKTAAAYAGAALFAASAVVLIACAVQDSMYKHRVNSLYSDIVMNKDFVADVLPPPAYIVEAYAAAFELRENMNDFRKVDLLVLQVCGKLRPDLETSMNYWNYELRSGSSDERAQFFGECCGYAKKFFDIFEKEYIPAIQSGRSLEADRLLKEKLNPVYVEHKKHINILVKMILERNLEKTVALISLKQRMRTIDSAILICGIILSLIAGIFLFIKLTELVKAHRALKERNIKLHELSYIDNLTGTHNRNYLQMKLNDSTGFFANLNSRGGIRTGFFMVDVDYFKRINDTEGHMFGDIILRKFADRLKKAVRSGDMIIRWGGEEFLVVTSPADSSLSAEIAERILSAARSNPFSDGQKEIHVTCSVGYCLFPFGGADDSGVTWKDAVKSADCALYEAKRRGRNQAVEFNSSI